MLTNLVLPRPSSWTVAKRVPSCGGLDWATTPLGQASRWPQSLHTAINICVNSRFPIALYWGPQFVMLYNDDLVPMVGANKHPPALLGADIGRRRRQPL